MNYYYDLITNFYKNNTLFYEWNNKENIIYLKKIPVIRVSSAKFNIIWNNKIIINYQDYLKIKDHTLRYITNGIKKYLDCLLITDTRNVIVIAFNSKGMELKRSTLLLKDDNNIIEYALNIKEKYLGIKIISHIKYDYLIKDEKLLINKIIKTINNMPSDESKYLYYELESIKEDNINTINTTIKNYISNNDWPKITKLKEIIKTMYNL